jgi:hypothetical protein
MTKLELEADTIDNFMVTNSISKLDFVKCDVEGAEYFVYQGGFETFKKHRPIIFTEMLRKWATKFNYHPNDIIKFLASLDYKCFVNTSGSLEAINNINEETKETNFFFLHNEKHTYEIEKFS